MKYSTRDKAGEVSAKAALWKRAVLFLYDLLTSHVFNRQKLLVRRKTCGIFTRALSAAAISSST